MALTFDRRRFAGAFTTRTMFLGATGALTAAGLVRFPAGAAEFTYKFFHPLPSTSTVAQQILHMASKILRDSDGRFEFQVFPAGQLGGEQEALSQIRLGATEFGLMIDIATGGLVPPVGVTSLPFISSSMKEILNMVSGPYADYCRGLLEKVGIYAFPGAWDSGGFRHILNSIRPIYSPADTKGLKIRAAPSADEVNAVKAFGGSPVAMAQPEVYANLQTHLADGAVVGPVAAQQFKFYEVQKYFSLIQFGTAPWRILANPGAWQRLPRHIQDVLTRNIEAARTASNAEMDKIPPVALEFLKTHGIQVNKADVDAFHKAIRDAGLYAQWKTNYGPAAWALLEKSIGHPLG